MINQQMYFYKYVHLLITVLLQHVSVISMTIIRVFYNRNTINVK